MPLIEFSNNTYLPLSPSLEPREAFITQTIIAQKQMTLALPSTPTTTMSVAETMIQSETITKADPTNKVLDSIIKIKEIFADENLSMALSKLELPSSRNPTAYDPIALVDAPMSGAAKLKRMLENGNELIVCPGVYDGLSARAAMEVGFDALYMVCNPRSPPTRKKQER